MIADFKYTFFLLLILILGCSSDENIEILNEQNSKVYNIDSVFDPAITGIAEVLENKNGSVTINIELINTIEGKLHPVSVRFNNTTLPEAIAVSLNAVNGTTGKSTTNIVALNNGTVLSYDSFLTLDAHISISESETDLTTLIGVADVGLNELTGQSQTYFLTETNSSGITGSIDFLERRNGEALASINIEGTITGESYSAHLKMNDVVTSGPVVFTFNTINGLDNVILNSKTNIANLDGETDFFGYNSLLDYSGYVDINNVPSSAIVAQTNIGLSEALVIPQTITYDVTNNLALAYVFDGSGLIVVENPDFTFKRGNTYIFNLDVAGHPFYIKTIQGIGTTDLYTDGIIGNGNVTGTLQFIVPTDAPDTLYYNSEFDDLMTGVISIED